MIEFQEVNKNINLPYQIKTFVDIYIECRYKSILILIKVKNIILPNYMY